MAEIKMQKIHVERVTIENCTYCSRLHLGEPAVELETPLDGYTHKVTCPITNKLIYLRFMSH